MSHLPSNLCFRKSKRAFCIMSVTFAEVRKTEWGKHTQREREVKSKKVEGKGTVIEQICYFSQSSPRGRLLLKAFFILNHPQLLIFPLGSPSGCGGINQQYSLDPNPPPLWGFRTTPRRPPQAGFANRCCLSLPHLSGVCLQWGAARTPQTSPRLKQSCWSVHVAKNSLCSGLGFCGSLSCSSSDIPLQREQGEGRTRERKRKGEKELGRRWAA